MDLKNLLLSGGIVATGLMSGLLYGWAVSVIPGTRRVADPNYIDTMQHINREIINPAFIAPFMGVPLVLGGAAFAHYRAGDQRKAWLLTAATATYVVGVLGVTMGRNVPLNDALGAFQLRGSSDSAVLERRETYETSWNRWHNVRTAAGVASFAIATAAAIVTED